MQFLLGPSGNAQGGHKFLTLTTGKVVTRSAWTELPTSAAVIERVHLLTKGMPALPIISNCASCVIGDVEDVYLHNIEDEDIEALGDDSNLPGVHTAEADDEIPGVDMVQEQDVDVDLNFAPADEGNVEPPLVDIQLPVNDAPVVSKVPTDGGTRRSTRVCTQPKLQYIPAFSGKTYSIATMVLGTRMLDNVVYSYNQSVALSFMQQLSVKAALREWGDNAKAAGEKQVNQLHRRETFIPRQMLELTVEQQTKILQSHMFIGQKQTGETKARMVAGGNTQQGHVTKEESSSPTVSTKTVLLTLIVNTHKGRDVAVIDIPNAFIQTRVDVAKDHVIIRITGVIVDWPVKVAPKVYALYVATNSKGVNSLLVECYNAIYGTRVAGLLHYHKFSSSLKNRGFTVKPVWSMCLEQGHCRQADDDLLPHQRLQDLAS